MGGIMPLAVEEIENIEPETLKFYVKLLGFTLVKSFKKSKKK